MAGGRGVLTRVNGVLGLSPGQCCPACRSREPEGAGYCGACGLRLNESLQDITDPKGAVYRDDVYLCFDGWPFPVAEPVTRSREQWALDAKITASGAGFVCIMLAASEMYIGMLVVGLSIGATSTILWLTGRSGARERSEYPHGAGGASRPVAPR